MKVTVKEKSQEKEYPWIGISNNDQIVLFTGYKCGISLISGETNNKFLEYSVSWLEEVFKPFEGEIVLSNS